MLHFLHSCSIFLIFSTYLIGQSAHEIYTDNYQSFLDDYVDGNGLVAYSTIQDDNATDRLVKQLSDIDFSSLNSQARKAFLINAYNLLVIHKVQSLWPIASVRAINGFFTEKDNYLAGKKYSLNDIEETLLLEVYSDPRLHFVLNCAALSCPPLSGKAYRSFNLEADLEAMTNRALKNDIMVKTTEDPVKLSKIFEWYKKDFGGTDQGLFAFISNYRDDIRPDAKVKFMPYDWRINSSESPFDNDVDRDPSDYRYVVSALIPTGGWELKFFNNLYSQTRDETGNFRESFFTTTVNLLYGMSDKLNIGLTMRYRKVHKPGNPGSSAFDLFSAKGTETREGLTGIGPHVRYLPFPNIPGFSAQSSLFFPLLDDMVGEGDDLFIDWDGPILINQFFYDRTLGSHFSLFTELDFNLEGIGTINRFSTPATMILSYFPTRNITLYGLAEFAPVWQSEFDYFYQMGNGFKYQITPSFELELLWTYFNTRFLQENNGKAYTYNFGIRLNL